MKVIGVADLRSAAESPLERVIGVVRGGGREDVDFMKPTLPSLGRPSCAYELGFSFHLSAAIKHQQPAEQGRLAVLAARAMQIGPFEVDGGGRVFNQELVLMRARVSKTTIDTGGIS